MKLPFRIVKEKMQTSGGPRMPINQGILEDNKSSAWWQVWRRVGDHDSGLEHWEKATKASEILIRWANVRYNHQGISPTVQEGSLVKIGNDLFLDFLSLGLDQCWGWKGVSLSVKNSPTWSRANRKKRKWRNSISRKTDEKFLEIS